MTLPQILRKSSSSIPPVQFTEGSSGSGQAFHLSRRRGGDHQLQHGGTEKISTLTTMYLGSIVILLLCALSCVVAVYRNTKLMEQNLALLEKQIYLQSTRLNDVEYINTKKFDRMISLKDECPPCPTEAPPTPIEPHKNPVSVLNAEMPNKAKYVVNHICIDPPISDATLHIENDPIHEGKTWSGKGSSKQGAKQAAAWNAIKNDFSYLIGEVADEYKPPELFNPLCNQVVPPP